ncbi:hypothetical protein BDA99DRAFT_508152 [Phascolomyces articulosus]|uniref:Uncharacterized protein n=1 Tax=Phascolomyces articulosus TaxID=60185 RepID=A0AAD5K2A2_9FUNG|nr:hypothetical protein BDA99DRAFT_508152 [Phascolomyces articulosus]
MTEKGCSSRGGNRKKAWNSDFWLEELSKLSSDHALKSDCWNTSSSSIPEPDHDRHYDNDWDSDNDQGSQGDSQEQEPVDLNNIHIEWSLSEDEDEDNNQRRVDSHKPVTTTHSSTFSSSSSSQPASLPQSPERQQLRVSVPLNEKESTIHTIVSSEATKSATDKWSLNGWSASSSTSLVDLEPISMKLAPVLTPTPIAPKKITPSTKQETTSVVAPGLTDKSFSPPPPPIMDPKDEDTVNAAPEMKPVSIEHNISAAATAASFGSFDFSLLDSIHDEKTKEVQQQDADKKESIVIDASVIETSDDYDDNEEDDDEDDYDDSSSSDEPKSIRLLSSIEDFHGQTNNLDENELEPSPKVEGSVLSSNEETTATSEPSSSPGREAVVNETTTTVNESSPEQESKVEVNDTHSITSSKEDEDTLSTKLSPSISNLKVQKEESGSSKEGDDEERVSTLSSVSSSERPLETTTPSSNNDVTSAESPSIISSEEVQTESEVNSNEERIPKEDDDNEALTGPSISNPKVESEASCSEDTLLTKSPSITSSKVQSDSPQATAVVACKEDEMNETLTVSSTTSSEIQSEPNVPSKDESMTPVQSCMSSPVMSTSSPTVTQASTDVAHTKTTPSFPIKTDLPSPAATAEVENEMKSDQTKTLLVDEATSEHEKKKEEYQDKEEEKSVEDVPVPAKVVQDSALVTTLSDQEEPAPIEQQEEEMEPKSPIVHEQSTLSPVKKTSVVGGTSLSMWADPKVKSEMEKKENKPVSVVAASVDSEQKMEDEKHHTVDQEETTSEEMVDQQAYHTGKSDCMEPKQHEENKEPATDHQLPFMQRHPEFTFSITTSKEPPTLPQSKKVCTVDTGSTTIKQEPSWSPVTKTAATTSTTQQPQSSWGGSNASIWSLATHKPISISSPKETEQQNTIFVSIATLASPQKSHEEEKDTTSVQKAWSMAASQQWGSNASIWNPNPETPAFQPSTASSPSSSPSPQQQQERRPTAPWLVSTPTQELSFEKQSSLDSSLQWTDTPNTQEQLQSSSQGSILKTNTTQHNFETSFDNQHPMTQHQDEEDMPAADDQEEDDEEYESGSEYETDSDSSVEQITISLASLIQSQKEEKKKEEVPVVRCTLTDLILGTKSEKIRNILDVLTGKAPSNPTTTSCVEEKEDEKSAAVAAASSSTPSPFSVQQQQPIAESTSPQQQQKQNDIHPPSPSPEVIETKDNTSQHNEHHEEEASSLQQPQHQTEKDEKDSATAPLDDEIKKRMLEKAKQLENIHQNNNLKLNAFAATFTPPSFVPATTATTQSEPVVEQQESETEEEAFEPSIPLATQQHALTTNKYSKAVPIVYPYNSHLTPEEAALYTPPKYFESDDQKYQVQRPQQQHTGTIQYYPKPEIPSSVSPALSIAALSHSVTPASPSSSMSSTTGPAPTTVTDTSYLTFNKGGTVFFHNQQQQQSTSSSKAATFNDISSSSSSIYAKPSSIGLGFSSPDIKLNISAPVFNPSDFKSSSS